MSLKVSSRARYYFMFYFSRSSFLHTVCWVTDQSRNVLGEKKKKGPDSCIIHFL